MLQTSAHILDNQVFRCLCVIVLHVTVNVVNVYCYCCGMCMYVLHVHLCLCQSHVAKGFIRPCETMYAFFFVHKCVRVCICFVYVGGYVDPHGHGFTRNIVRYLVSNGIRGSPVSLMVLYKEMIIL